MRYGPGSGGAVQGKPPPSVAATKKAIAHHVDHYADDPVAHAKALRGLGVPAKVVQHAHKQLAPLEGTRTGRSFTGGRSLTARESSLQPPLGGEAVTMAQRRKDLANLAKTVKRIQSGPTGGPGSLTGFLEAGGFGIPIGTIEHPLRALQHVHNTISPEKTANVNNALPMVEGLSFGGGFRKLGAKAAGPVARTVRKMPEGMPPEVQASAKKITAGLSFGGAKKIRSEQEALRQVERGKRAGAAEQAMAQTPGVQGYYAAKHELRGELPKLQFNALKDKFGDKEVQDLFTYISNHETLRPYEKIDTHRALLKAFGGEVPTTRERALLNKTFGPEFTRSIMGSRPMLAKLKHAGLEIANIPRSFMASADVSAPFRQGLVAGARHPAMFAKNFPLMLRQFGSERVHQDTMNLIHENPLYGDATENGLSLTELGPLEHREEQFMSNYAEHIPVAGRVVRASGRAYVGFLDKMRMDMYAHHAEAAQKFYGGNLTPEQKHGIATFINSATGRGDLGRFQNAAVHLNTLFFSPRLMASRFNFLNPTYYMKLDPYSRREALKSMRNLVGFVGSVLALAKAGGAQVNMDPRNADWAKIKIGNTRIDLLGGFQQPIRLFAQVASGKVISSTTGDTLTLGPGYGKMNRQDIIKRFLEGKLAPTPSMVNDWLKGSDFQHQPFSVKRELIAHMIPLAIQDAHDLYHSKGSLALGLGAYTGSAVGLGVQTYGPQDRTKTAKQRHDQLTTAFEQNVQKYYHRGLTPQIKKALGLREAREVYLAKNLSKKSSALDRFNAQVDLLLQMKMIDSGRAQHAKAWAAKADDHVVKSETSRIGFKYFGGVVLSDAAQKIRAKGGKFYLSDKSTWAP